MNLSRPSCPVAWLLLIFTVKIHIHY
jgi:hypothetical protein